jgi:hypothetical protein
MKATTTYDAFYLSLHIHQENNYISRDMTKTLQIIKYVYHHKQTQQCIQLNVYFLNSISPYYFNIISQKQDFKSSYLAGPSRYLYAFYEHLESYSIFMW